MKNNFFPILFLLGFTIQVNAMHKDTSSAKWFIGFSSGINYSKLATKMYYPTIGTINNDSYINITYDKVKHFQIGTGIGLSTLQYKTIDNSHGYENIYINKFQLLQLPFNLNYLVLPAKKINPYLTMGVKANLLSYANYNAFSLFYYSALGIKYKLHQNYYFSIESQYQKDVFPINQTYRLQDGYGTINNSFEFNVINVLIGVGFKF